MSSSLILYIAFPLLVFLGIVIAGGRLKEKRSNKGEE